MGQSRRLNGAGRCIQGSSSPCLADRELPHYGKESPPKQLWKIRIFQRILVNRRAWVPDLPPGRIAAILAGQSTRSE